MRHPVAAPPIPERIRTLAATATPTHVSVTGTDIPACPARGGVDTAGRPVLLVKPGEFLYGTATETLVTVDLVATRDLGGVQRPRGLLKVQGWTQDVPGEEARETAVAIAERCPDDDLLAALDGGTPKLLRLDIGRVIYLTGQESGLLDAGDYLASAPDPFLDTAERLIRHVNEAHREQLVQSMGRLTGENADDAWLWELDRYGATVRMRANELVRLPWPVPLPTRTAFEQAVTCLVCPH
ncbi:DUF2470 domain-containing protein [Sphaerimonospora mesophila]|uniref:DUF2470 domain-containing protein n=1 Tax=Sphaerimonospora mesophila TaxID=37483 RepID=UPI0006E264C8